MIVIDLGCHTHGEDDSVQRLCEKYEPLLLLGFDPHPGTLDRIYRWSESTTVVTRRAAAWTRTGSIGYSNEGTRGHVTADGAGLAGIERVPCFDLAALLTMLPSQPVLKMDIEGAEYPLLRRLVATGTDALVGMILIEWHTGDLAHGQERPIPDLRCPIEAWH